ncbi:MAG: WD40 repeat domain-containing protein, partial [Paramuribaculum sp.]|nr:WD40 repeat domain-containing protein [Paramuribaculum sp.]
MKKLVAAVLTAVSVGAMASDTINVEIFRYAGPFPIGSPVVIDSLDVNSRKFDIKSVLDMPMNIEAALKSGKQVGSVLPSGGELPAVNVISFDVTNRGYATPILSLSGLNDYKIFIDGNQATVGELTLKPATHTVAVKYLSQPGKVDTIGVSLDVPDGQTIEIGGQNKLYTLDNVLHGKRIYSTEVSPDGKYLITIYSNGLKGGDTVWEWVVTTSEGKPVARSAEAIGWMPSGSRYYRTTVTPAGRTIFVTEAATGVETIFAQGIPAGGFTISPDEKYLILTQVTEGPKEHESVYRILEPEDRQPGWRKRSSLAQYDIATGMMRPLTFGHHNVYLLDISDDASKLLVSTSRSRLSKRPTTVTTLAVLDLNSMKLDTIVADDGFLGSAMFSPDASQVLVLGSPEALGGIGKNVPEGRIPSMIDTQLFLYNIGDGKFTPLTREFDPNVTSARWSRADGQIYFVAENRDCISAFRLNPSNGKIIQLPLGQDIIKGISLPDVGVNAAFCAQSMDNPDRLYNFNNKTLKRSLLAEHLAADLADV